NKNPSIHPDPEMSEPRPRIVPGPFRMNRWVNDKMDEIKRCREEVRFQIGYEDIRASAPMSEPVLREIVELIVGVLCRRWEYININRQPLPVTAVQEQFELLNKEHIQYVLECMNRSRTKILNPRAYILTSLYNAPNTIQSYYDAKVRHDMAQPSWYETPYSRRAS
ncbi:MAG: hypothetical protein IJT94_11430, partial [Oscillibacter sp.]|nr:hypothetical protein [Oscillibacter sp.]